MSLEDYYSELEIKIEEIPMSLPKIPQTSNEDLEYVVFKNLNSVDSCFEIYQYGKIATGFSRKFNKTLVRNIPEDQSPSEVPFQKIYDLFVAYSIAEREEGFYKTLESIHLDLAKTFIKWRDEVYDPFLWRILNENEKASQEQIYHALRKLIPSYIKENVFDIYFFEEEMTIPDFGESAFVKTSSKSQPSVFLNTTLQTTMQGRFIFIYTVNYSCESGILQPVVNLTKIKGWPGCRTIQSLGIDLHLQDEEIKEFAEKGKRVAQITKQASYLKCNGSQSISGFFGDTLLSSRGRVMIDLKGWARSNPNVDEDVDEKKALSADEISEKVFSIIKPDLYGFSFVTKKWGKFHVDEVEEISFKEDAFNQLIIDEDDKNIMLSICQNIDSTINSDFIEDKGGGCIFLLHGKPGLGKTLTAEAIAEVTRKPLYSVSVGELGTNPSSLEDSLKRVLDISTRWGAILLLDEADIFLEKRSSGDMERNAMVGIFLRLLEYYNGILILTSNRVKNIDPAFYSRISFAKKYEDHTSNTRRKIIQNLLKVYEINLEESGIDKLSSVETNGRKMKNCLRIAKFLAKSKNREVKAEDIILVLDKMENFENKIQQEEDF